ncbi:MAG: hypothetical protein KBH12_08640 [Synergistaceae bacterium]|nr:hypothetical protein [Synergistaceae bacterium]MBP9626724.1 hypothetical protein [Synergistaceae bacterium]
MRAQPAKHENPTQLPRLCIYSLIVILVASMSLGGLRLYGLYLEHQLADITQRLQIANDKNIVLEERNSALLSPARIYTYARIELKMIAAQKTRTIQVEAGAPSVVKNPNRTVQMASNVYDRYLSPIFVKRANAKD